MRVGWAMGVGLVACAPPSPGVAPQGPPALAALREAPGLAGSGALTSAPLPERDLPASGGPIAALPRRDESPIAAMAEEIRSATLDPDLGAALMDAWKDLPPSRRSQGLAGFTVDVLGGPMCESPRLVDTFEADGQTWVARWEVGAFLRLLGDPTPLVQTMTTACSAGLAAADGDIDAALAAGACTEIEVSSFFVGEDGAENACAACVRAAGEVGSCIDAGTCEDVAPARTWFADNDGNRVYHELMGMDLLGCAPDWTTSGYLLVDRDEGEIPRPFDTAHWAGYCVPVWSEASGGPSFACDTTHGKSVGEGVEALLWDLRAEDDDRADALPWHARTAFASRARIAGGPELRWNLVQVPGDGYVSLPLAEGGYGIDPYALKPGGTDRSDPDQTWAREWLATVAMKHSTTRDGITISIALSNACAAWDGPDAAGRYRCATPTAPPDPLVELRDLYDDETSSAEGPDGPWTPIGPLTLASAGRPDPDVPGGFVVHMAGSDTLADDGWDACRYPRSFVPDTRPISDTPWPGVDLVNHALTIDTYRFDKPENTDGIVAVLRTNQARGFCPADATGVGWRTIENLDQNSDPSGD